MLKFIVLGLLPGTDTQIPFELFINAGAITLLIILVRLLWRHSFNHSSGTNQEPTGHSLAQ